MNTIFFRRSLFAALLLVTSSIGILTLYLANAASTLSPAPEGSFSLVVIPDTQRYRGAGTKSQPDSKATVSNTVFAAHTQWIAENIDNQRIAFVTHVGDIVDKNIVTQWTLARQYMDALHGKVPYGIVVGNHDMSMGGNSSLFQKYFPASHFQEFDWYGGTYAGNPERPGHSSNNANSYQLISAEGIAFIMIHLECNAPDPVVAWANSLLDTHQDRLAIISTHMDLGPLNLPEESKDFFEAPKGRMRWHKMHGDRGNTPAQLWDKLYRKHANLLMVVSGDQSRTSAMRLDATGDHGNTVYGLLSDYTSSGPLRIYRFEPTKNTIQVITYDTTRKEVIDASMHVPGRENHQFTLQYDFNKAE